MVHFVKLVQLVKDQLQVFISMPLVHNIKLVTNLLSIMQIQMVLVQSLKSLLSMVQLQVKQEVVMTILFMKTQQVYKILIQVTK